MKPSDAAALAALPRIDALVEAAGNLVERYGRAATTDALRAAVEEARTRVRSGGEVPPVPDLVADAGAALASAFPGPPRRVVNAAGIIVHTNLGRAPLSTGAIAAVQQAAGYCDLEYDVDSGGRGSRGARLGPLLRAATGAQAGMAVNNAAAALVLAVQTLAGGREVLVSRGELVEIGGSFRLPDILAAAGVRLVEVGTTNRTRASDYEAGDDAALVLKVHPSNYRLSGFVEEATVAELAAVAVRRGIPLLHDVGSGLLEPSERPALHGEPSVRDSLAQGADLVVCSGDKLLGGPQAGLLVGRSDLVAACAGAPLARALRLDKLRVAALVATLEAHVSGRRDELPVWEALTADDGVLRDRSAHLAATVGGTVVEATTMVGGGAAPGQGVDGPVVRVGCPDPDGAARNLRNGAPPIVVRVGDGALLVDLRTVEVSDDALLAERLVAAVRS